MYTTGDATTFAADTQAPSNDNDRAWANVAVENLSERQATYQASTADRASRSERAVLEIPALDGSSEDLHPDGRTVDPRASFDELVDKGALVDNTDVNDPPGELRTKPLNEINVVPLDKTNSTSPDFVIGSDGQVVMLKNPDYSNASSITIEVDRTNSTLTSAEQQSLDGLVTYLSERLMKCDAEGNRIGEISDQDSLVSIDAAGDLNLTKNAGANNHSENFSPSPGNGNNNERNNSENFSPNNDGDENANSDNFSPVADVSSGGSSSAGSGSAGSSSEGSGSAGSSDGSANDNSNQLSKESFVDAVKNVSAFMNDAVGPQRYDLVNLNSRGESEVGPYSLDYNKIVDWLKDLLGNPPDLSKLDDLVKRGLLSKDLVGNIQSKGFEDFVTGLKNGELPSSENLKKFLPKEFQDLIANDMIEKFSSGSQNGTSHNKTIEDVAAAALSLKLGHTATDDDIDDNQTYFNNAVENAGIQINEPGSAGGDSNHPAVDMDNLNDIFFTQFYNEQWNNYGDALPYSSNCGPASLSMVLRFLGVGPEGVDLYGDPNPLVDQVRIMMTGANNSGEGTNVDQVGNAAMSLGLTSTPIGGLDQINEAIEEGKGVVVGGDPIAYNQGMTIDDYASHTVDGQTSVFTGGHIIAVVGRSGDDYIVLDPAYKHGVLTLSADELAGFMAPDGDYAGVAIGRP